MKKLSLCITTWKRSDIVLKAFEKVINDERIGEIVISSDADEGHHKDLLMQLWADHPKVQCYVNKTRLGVYGNKHAAVKAAKHDWVVIFDSDNVLEPHYLDCLYSYTWKSDQIFAPDFAKPHFDYTAFAGKLITRENVHTFIGKPKFDCFLNTMNYFCHKENYLKVWEPKENVIGSDSIFFNKLWLQAGGSIYVINGMRYEHLVHEKSYFQSVAVESTPMCKAIENELKQLR